MQVIEKLTDVSLLRSKARAGGFNDRGIQSQAFGNVDAGGGSGHSKFELVGGLERGLVETHGSILYYVGVGAVDFERGVVGRDDGDAADSAKVFCDGDGEGSAFFGISGRAQFVEQDERVRRGGARDEIDIGDVRGEG